MNPFEKTSGTPNDENSPERDTARSSENPKAPSPGADYPVVGIGASAGGVQALQDFFKAMPANPGMAFVVILHLERHRDSHLAPILGRCTDMTVTETTASTPLEANHVFIIPPDHILRIQDHTLQLSQLPEDRLKRKPVDAFFQSLAEACGKRAIGIILSGTGGNGSVGVKEIKKAGGIVLAQDPQEAAYEGMPKNAIGTGSVDRILKIGAMSGILTAYAHHPYLLNTTGADEKADDDGTASQADHEKEWNGIRAVIEYLRSETGREFRCFKKKMLVRRVQRRMGLRDLTDVDRYLQELQTDPQECQALIEDLLIGVTRFFRDAEAWEALRQEVVCQLIADGNSSSPIRAWVPGCASGEEAYTLAILLYDEAEKSGYRGKIKVFATDVGMERLQRAREGVFPDSIELDVPPAVLERYFNKEEDSYRLVSQIRELVVFANQDLISDPPFSQLDLVSCRNLMIYLEAETQNKVLALFHFALKPGGCLFLGPAETVGGKRESLYETVSKKWRIYRRIGPARHDLISFPLYGTQTARRELDHMGKRLPAAQMPRMNDLMNRALAARFGPAAVLVNPQLEVAYFHGNTEPYLARPTGLPTANLLDMARDGIRHKLQEMVTSALSLKRQIRMEDARVRDGGTWTPLVITASPVRTGIDIGPLVVLTFETIADEPPETLAKPLPATVSGETDELVNELQEELRVNRFDLESTIQELESANEEQKASNEEITSMNEELQSTNEELETSKEELQSLNEELTTTNQELHSNLQELENINNDLSNLLTSTDIATIFLDGKLHIRWFSPAVRELFSIISSDIGRSITDFSCKAQDPDLFSDAREVMQKLGSVKRQVKGGDKWYLRRTLPYRTVDDRIAGVVITFTDITDLLAARKELEKFNQTLETQVRQRTRQLRKLSLELSRAEENERRRIAEILHDDLQQILAGARYCLDRVNSDTGAGEKNLGQVYKFIDQAIQATRQLSHQLSPPILQEGLVPALEWTQRWFKEKNAIDLHLHLDPEAEPQALELRYLMFTACREMLLNIVKHAGVEKADLYLERKNGTIRLKIEDQGRGFDPGAIESAQSNGFGLLNLRERISAISGEMTIDSRPEKGTRIIITIPETAIEEVQELQQPAASPGLPPPDVDPPLGGALRILLVDDHEVMREGLRTLLKDEPGIEVIGEAPDGETALDIIAKEHPEIVLMDVSMPGMGGVEATRRIQDQFPRTAVIALSMHDASDRAEAMVAAGAHAYVQKTASLETLLSAIHLTAKHLKRRG
jgi:chemotaxis methyl-accepting protein methylase/chemotaxis response regulator CheB/signal transduction histidine kinase